MATLNVAFLISSIIDFRFVEMKHICRLPMHNGKLTKAAEEDVKRELYETDYPFASYYDYKIMDFRYIGNLRYFTDEQLQGIMENHRRNFSTKYAWAKISDAKTVMMTVPMTEGDYKMHWSLSSNNKH